MPGTILWSLTGAAAASALVLIWYVLNGAIGTLWQVYFVDNLTLYSQNIRGGNYADPLPNLLNNLSWSIPAILGLVGMLITAKKTWRELMAVVLGAAALFIFTYASGRKYPYYAMVMACFAPLGFGMLFRAIPASVGENKTFRWGATALAMLAAALSPVAALHWSNNVYLMSVPKEEIPPYRFAETIRQSEDRTLLNYGFLDGGYYLAADSQPVTRFFCTLNNDLPEMKEEQQTAIAEGRTAFVITRGMGGSQRQRPGGGQKESVDMSAYRPVDTCSMVFEGFEWTYTLYERIVYHNGEYFGCYLALEGVDKSFAKRNYGKDYGKLYKPELGKGDDRDKEPDTQDEDDGKGFGAIFGGNGFPAMPNFDGKTEGGSGFPAFTGQGDGEGFGGKMPTDTDGGEKRDRPHGFNFGMFGMGGGSGAKSDSELARALNYVGDDLETYQSIWDSAKFKSDDADHQRVVEALKHVSERDNIGDYVDVDNVLKYMAIQAFIYNNDGLTDEETHNYYLYEQDGKLNLIPWDMNQSFSVSGDGSDYVNFPIDTPFTVSDLSQRDFFMALLENEEYLAQYHEYLRQLSEEYVLGGKLAETFERIRGQIDAYVETDPTAFCDYDQFDATAKGIQTAAELRAESVLGQISGEIPSTRDGQSAEPEKLLDTSSADLSGLTSGFGMGRMNFTMPKMPGNQ